MFRKTIWSQGPRTFRIHFNFFGYSSSYPGSTCTVIAAQLGGQTLVKSDVACGTRASSEATTGDPGVVVTFDESGRLQSVNSI